MIFILRVIEKALSICQVLEELVAGDPLNIPNTTGAQAFTGV